MVSFLERRPSMRVRTYFVMVVTLWLCWGLHKVFIAH
jgi:hypothetical protein